MKASAGERKPRHFRGVVLMAQTMSWMAWATRTNLIARVGAGVFLGLFVLGNSMHLSSFLEFGRGNYSAAVQLMGSKRRVGP